MRTRRLSCAALVGGILVLATQAVVPEEKTPGTRPPSPTATTEPGPSERESLIESLVRYTMPGDAHKRLGRMVGRWNMTIRYWMNAQAPVVESKGTAERRWILGNRFVREDFDGGNLGLPYQGMAVYGYDSFEQKYTSVWVDTMSTAMTLSFGTCQESCDVIAFTGRHADPWTGVQRPTHGVTRFVNENQHVLELYEPGTDGKEFKLLEITYARADGETTKE